MAFGTSFVQATESKHALLAYLRGGLARQTPRICHAVVFPDAVLSEAIGMQPRAIILDRADLTAATLSVERILDHWGQLESAPISTAVQDRIVRGLAPTVVIRRRLNVEIAEAEEEIFSLTERQVASMAAFRRNRRCVTTGGAGTGKSVLAVEKARQMSLDSGRVLLVCFNALLAERLRFELHDTDVTVRTFHALCLELSRAAGRPIRHEDRRADARGVGHVRELRPGERASRGLAHDDPRVTHAETRRGLRGLSAS